MILIHSTKQILRENLEENTQNQYKYEVFHCLYNLKDDVTQFPAF